jgi:hypothetical protein
MFFIVPAIEFCSELGSRGEMLIKKCVLVEAVQRFDAAEGSYIMQNRRPKHRWCPGAELNHRHTDFQSVALPTELPGRLVSGAYRGNLAFLSSRA